MHSLIKVLGNYFSTIWLLVLMNTAVPFQKDFFLSERQVLQGFNKGADSFLLIIDAVSEENAKKLIQFAEKIKTEVLAEFHSFDHIEFINEFTAQGSSGARTT